jgi:glycosyltransferase involved in cell wall biosynthesis
MIDNNSPSTPNCYQDYVKISRRRDQGAALDATALRTRSTEIRKLFAWHATKKRMTIDTLMAALEAYRDPSRRHVGINALAVLDREWSVRLARLMAFQNIFPDDRINAKTLYQVVSARFGIKNLDKEHVKIIFDINLSDRDFISAETILRDGTMEEAARRFSSIDICNPNVRPASDPSFWLRQFGSVFSERGFEAVSMEEPEAAFRYSSPFDKLSCKPTSFIEDGPLVSAVVSVWDAGQGLLSSINSLLNQSWQNIEILIVDDASDAESKNIISYCAKLDDRIRVLVQSENQGTYAARNLALKNCRGEFITFQDADDWSHPRRIEMQVLPLIAERDLMATSSRTVRVNEELLFSNVGYPNPERLNTSSLMFRRKEVNERIGFFDSVRKAADSEYLKRIEVTFGKSAYRALPDVLSIVRLGDISLSRSDFRVGWHHPARMAYRDAYVFWHKQIAAGLSSPYRAENTEDRPFPAPVAFAIDRSAKIARRYFDVIVMGDWRRSGGPQNSMIEEIMTLKERGYSVAISHLEAYRFMTSRMEPLSQNIQRLINSGVVDQVSYTDDVKTSLILVRYPPIFQFTPDGRSNIDADNIVLIVNQAPHEKNGTDIRYESHDCIRNIRTLFEKDAIWVPQGPLVREMIEPVIPNNLLSEVDMFGIIVQEDWDVGIRPLSAERPVIGRYSRDDPMKFPETVDSLLEIYPASNELEVQIMGGIKSCKKLLGGRDIPENWIIHEYGEFSSQEFLKRIDFFVHFDHSDIVEAFGRSILEAIASGRVVVLPRKFEQVFGEGAVYCAPS